MEDTSGVTTSADALILLELSTGTSRRIIIPRPGTGGVGISPDVRYLAATPDDQSSSQLIFIASRLNEKIQLPFEERAALDIVCNADGAEIGVPWFPDAGDIWRKGVTARRYA